MARLIAHLPDGTTRQFKLEPGRTTIGRRADNDVCLPFPAISAEHAAVVTIGADSFLEDLESTNGTLVNGERVSKHFLRDGDRIDIGRLELVYLAGDETKGESLSARSSGVAQDRAEPESDAEAVAAELSLDTRRVEESFGVTEDADAAPADELLAELMETQSPATAAVDIPPTLSVVPPPANPPVTAPGSNGSKVQFAEALVTILSGPNAGKTTPMTRAQFVFGRPGVTVAAIRRSGGNYRLVPLGGDALPTVNGDTIAREGIELSFGDTIDVAGVRLRFERRA